MSWTYAILMTLTAVLMWITGVGMLTTKFSDPRIDKLSLPLGFVFIATGIALAYYGI